MYEKRSFEIKSDSFAKLIHFYCHTAVAVVGTGVFARLLSCSFCNRMAVFVHNLDDKRQFYFAPTFGEVATKLGTRVLAVPPLSFLFALSRDSAIDVVHVVWKCFEIPRL